MLKLRIRKNWKKLVSMLLQSLLSLKLTPLHPIFFSNLTSPKIIPRKPNALASSSSAIHNSNHHSVPFCSRHPIASVTKIPSTLMEVEVKLHILDTAAHEKLSKLLMPFHTETILQENIFFDGAKSELSSRQAVLRLRFYNSDSRCVVCLKAKAVIADGISRVEEDEEDMDPSLARLCTSDPSRLTLVDSNRILKRAREEFGCRDFVCLGGFHNVRMVYDWEGYKLELDKTQYEFGTSFELECESTNPEPVKKLLEEFLQQNGIPYRYSDASKFATFRSGKLP